MQIRMRVPLPGPFVLTSGGHHSGQLAVFITGLVILGLVCRNFLVVFIAAVLVAAVAGVVVLVRRW